MKLRSVNESKADRFRQTVTGPETDEKQVIPKPVSFCTHGSGPFRKPGRDVNRLVTDTPIESDLAPNREAVSEFRLREQGQFDRQGLMA